MRDLMFVYAGFALLMALYARRCWLDVGSQHLRRDAMARNGLQFAVPVFLLSAGATVYCGCLWLQG